MNEESKQSVEQLVCADPDLSSLVVFYLNDDVTAEERLKIEEHLLHCDSCNEELRLFELVQKVMETDMTETASVH